MMMRLLSQHSRYVAQEMVLNVFTAKRSCEILLSVTVLGLSGDIIPAHLTRITVEPTTTNGLPVPSQIMVDKAVRLPREKVGQIIGSLDREIMRAVSKALIAFFGLE